MTPADTVKVAEIAGKLSEAQRAVMLTCDPNEVSKDQYLPFWRAGLGLFRISPGWAGLEMTELGLAVRAHLSKELSK